MRFQTVAGALALAGTSAASSDSAPFVMLSSSKFPDSTNNRQIQTGSQTLKYAMDALSLCPTERYLIASQPGVNAADLRGTDGCAVPQLCKAVEDSRNKGKYVVSEVVGGFSGLEVSEYIRNVCSKKGAKVTIDDLNLEPMTSDRASSLAGNDLDLGNALEVAMKDGSYTILYIGAPAESTYDAEFEEPVRMDLKRDVSANMARKAGNATDSSKLSLFDKYQFFTPGIFMGIIGAIVLLSILGVGLSALGSLKVPYGAFDKDMGPSAQKKQQ